MIPGSSWPGLVPIGRPSSAVKPKVHSTLFPAEMAHALVIKRLREGVTVGHVGMTAVKGRIEVSDLEKLRLPRPHRADRSQIVRLMQRRKRRERIETLQHGLGDHRRRAVIRTAMHDTVTNGGRKFADMRPQKRGRYFLDFKSGPGPWVLCRCLIQRPSALSAVSL